MDISNLYSKKNNIFQSDLWAEFQASVGREAVEIEGIYFYKADLIKGKEYLFAPKGPCEKLPITNYQLPIKSKFPNDQILFIRVEPSIVIPTKEGSRDSSMPRNDTLKPVTKDSLLSQQYSPKQSLVLELKKSEDEILAKMKSKHRYNIRLAEKKGVIVKSGYSKEDVNNFYKLSLEVSKRDKTFSPHDEEYYQKMAETLGPKGHLEIFTAFYNDEPISSILILFYNETAIYLHGASSNNHRELMPNHLVQWTAMREAKKRGCVYYDFWGVAVKKETGVRNKETGDDSGQARMTEEWTVDEGHAWAGITKFKLGFIALGETGEVVEFPGAFDLIISPFWYRILALGAKIKKMIK